MKYQSDVPKKNVVPGKKSKVLFGNKKAFTTGRTTGIIQVFLELRSREQQGMITVFYEKSI